MKWDMVTGFSNMKVSDDFMNKSLGSGIWHANKSCEREIIGFRGKK